MEKKRKKQPKKQRFNRVKVSSLCTNNKKIKKSKIEKRKAKSTKILHNFV